MFSKIFPVRVSITPLDPFYYKMLVFDIARRKRQYFASAMFVCEQATREQQRGCL